MAVSSNLSTAFKKALGGGIPGAMAMVLQVVLLMWLRTTINYQYRHGTSLSVTLTTLYSEGGIGRFYQGMGPALIQGPLSRFGDTAANEGMKSFLSGYSLPVWVVTLAASLAAAAWRIVITPVDAVKTFLQVEGKDGLKILGAKVSKYGVMSLYDGWAGTWMATLAGHYPWFVTYNFLDARIGPASPGAKRLMRRAFIGFCASFVSDCVANGFRVVKTYVQTSSIPVGYFEAVSAIVTKDGLSGIFFRGLSIKIISNGISAMLFSVLWKTFIDIWEQRAAKSEQKQDLDKTL